ncbi:2OG-Fe(II) oxygenase [Alteromonas lipolytica]|uniref:2OG-Fe(II) oxygenase n=1 Tax=Alteromonas lipolytica TaxID=1856405 RepID=A0A1E8FHI1_9ALTE|nr:2OG-Fe(II) oxygenase [Alteromonas lipolytica]OFI34923.1 2OG-Fe(II) oxygenase [Alteromonas lipolytica]GGF55127.1 SM-20 [Alteromonas lipolytica]
MNSSSEDQILNGSAAPETLFEGIAQDLIQRGYSIIPNALSPALTSRLSAYAMETIDFDPAGIGRASQFHQNEFVRTDEICWIQGTAAVTTAWLNWMDCLKSYLNQRLFLGLFSYESHFAHYPPGSFYKRHLDAFSGESNRVLSTVFYLNSDWGKDDGGELVIYLPNEQDDCVSVTPLAGTLVIFLSEEFPHEVLPANRDRFSIAGWFRVNNSTAQRVDPPR